MIRPILSALAIGLALSACCHREEEPLPAPAKTFDGAGIEEWAARIEKHRDPASLANAIAAFAYLQPDSTPHLERWLGEGSTPESLFAMEVAAHLPQREADRLRGHIQELLGHPEVEVRAAAARAFGTLGFCGREDAFALAPLLDDHHWSVRYHAACSLGRISVNEPAIIGLLRERSRHDRDARVRDACAGAHGNGSPHKPPPAPRPQR